MITIPVTLWCSAPSCGTSVSVLIRITGLSGYLTIPYSDPDATDPAGLGVPTSWQIVPESGKAVSCLCPSHAVV